MTGDAVREWRGWVEWLKKEFEIDWRFVPIKTIIFLFTGGVVAFLPYLTLHMQQLGISVEEIAIMYAVLPVASLLGPPTTGIIADRTGKYGLMFMGNIALTGVFHTLLLWVPPVPTTSAILQCHEGGHALVWESCDECHDHRNGTIANLELRNCEFECVPPPMEFTMCGWTDEATANCHAYNITDTIELNVTLKDHSDLTCSHTWLDIQHQGNVYQNLTCFAPCPVRCQVKGAPQCRTLLNRGSPAATFWTYFILRLIASFFMGSAFTMMDAVTLAQINELGGEFGKQRVMTMVGSSIIPLASGIIVDRIGAATGIIDYMPAFYLGDALLVVCVVLVSRLELKVDMPKESLTKGLKEIVTKVEIDIFLILILILGSNLGFIESYLFVYLIELKAPNYLLGLTVTVGCLISIPMLFWADGVTAWMGRHNVFFISFLAYGVRMFGYAYMTSPWMCFPFEALEVFTYQLMWVAAATYCPILAPKGLLATMTGLAGAVHYSVGKGVGAFAGGYMIAHLTTPGAFKVFGAVAFGGGFFYFIVHQTFMKKLVLKREKELEAVKAEEANKVPELPAVRRASHVDAHGRKMSVTESLM